jgi:hypothetical protein
LKLLLQVLAMEEQCLLTHPSGSALKQAGPAAALHR